MPWSVSPSYRSARDRLSSYVSPSPNCQEYTSAPCDWFVNCTVRGAGPADGERLNAATGGTWTVIAKDSVSVASSADVIWRVAL